MKKLFLYNLALIWLLAWTPAAAQQLPMATVPSGESQEPQPSLMIEAPTYFAGQIQAGSVVQHSFEIKNQGTAPLKIIDFRTGCSCTVADFDRTIPPGQTGRIVIGVRTYREWARREFRKTSWVMTNDPVQPQLRLIMSGQMLPMEDQDGANQQKLGSPAGQ